MMTTEYIPPAAYTPAADRLAEDPHNADLRKAAKREDLLYDTIGHAARKVNRWKADLQAASRDLPMRDVLPITQQGYIAEVEYALWQMVVQASGPSMNEPLAALANIVRWAREQALDALEDKSTDLTDARIFARWVRKAEELMK